MTQRSSVMFRLEGVDGAEPRLVARAELITLFASMGHSDLCASHLELMSLIKSDTMYADLDARELTRLLELHTRATSALQVLLALRDPDELVEQHIKSNG